MSRMGDIEQIEVVRGPGAVMWGPNAVNGVINIITKKAQQTTGTQVNASAGNEARTLESRWGAAPNDKIAYRIWGKLDYRTPAYGSPGDYYFDTLPIGTLPFGIWIPPPGAWVSGWMASPMKRTSGWFRAISTKPIARIR